MLDKDPTKNYVTIDGGAVPCLVRTMQGPLRKGKRDKENERKHLLIAANARAKNERHTP